MDFQAVELQFQLPSQYYHWRSKPAHFLAHLIGHEGPGSLHSHLKQKGLLVRLSCGNQPQARGIDFFKITAFLTPEGFSALICNADVSRSYSCFKERYREVVLIMCKYLNMLRDAPSFPIHLYQELKTLAETRFNFAEKRPSEGYVSSLSEQMQRPYPPEYVLCGNALLWDWDEPLVRRVLAELVPENGRVIVMGKDYAPLGLEDPSVKWEQEKWYKTTYNIEMMDSRFLAESKKPNDLKELYLPPKNDYMPTNLTVDKHPVEKVRFPSSSNDGDIYNCTS